MAPLPITLQLEDAPNYPMIYGVEANDPMPGNYMESIPMIEPLRSNSKIRDDMSDM